MRGAPPSAMALEFARLLDEPFSNRGMALRFEKRNTRLRCGCLLFRSFALSVFEA